ncbi:alpha/beta hydrolase family protein [Spirillospora sp. NBC_01491]|uniref:alpha/beta hydrolase family protein n=1 Tax=Spirillospora sp. NBC_01491 TaxID=2976007 RepID=UPI002E339E32|nr:alpha/beta hydrolase [Spirillospora sp. NBC_01491]
MTSFLDLPGIVPAFVEGNRSRAAGAGLDPYGYDRVTSGLASLHDWPDAFRQMGREHLARAGNAASGRSAGEHYRDAARWFHFAVLLPHPDRDAACEAAQESDRAMARALEILDPGARRVEGPGFAGWLRRPAADGPEDGDVPTVVVVPGLDSSKEEFHGVVEALLSRGAAVFAMDGPGQGVLAVTSAPEAAYHRVLGRVIDALGVPEVAVIGLSLGGFYAAESAAYEPRVRTTATVSGPYRLDWDGLAPFVTETLAQRSGGVEPAREFVRAIDLTGAAGRITGPLLVVDGGQDVIPGAVNGAPLARTAPQGEYLLVPHGDHLLGNARTDWLPATADRLTRPVPAGG